MGRSGGTYTRTNGTFTGATVWTQDKDAGTKITAANHDTHDQDIAAALTASLAADGQTTPTADLPMGGFKHTGVANGSARTHYAAIGQVQDGTANFGGTTGGSSTAYTISLTPAITAYVDGAMYKFRAHTNNTTTTPTLNINGVGAVVIKVRGSALSVGRIVSTAICIVVYDSTNACFQLVSA